jgi:hypothetical protein
MGVPGSPSRTARYTRAGEVDRRQAGLVKSRGGVENADARTPRPSPREPWHKAQYLA